jgi:ketosteroid isomerase-like protein
MVLRETARVMSQENVGRVKAALDAYNREGPEAIIDLLDPDVEWIADRSDMGRVTYRGVEGVRKSFEELYEGFDKFGMEVDELIEAGEKILVLGQMTARGRSTQVEAKLPLAIVFTVGEDGKLIRYESFRDAGEAREAVGL